MAVIITNMDMPKCCGDCPLLESGYGHCELGIKIAFLSEKASDCPLKSIDDYILRETVFDFKVKLDKWLFLNHEDVCGQRMVDIDYLSGEIWELFTELGIVRYDEDGKEIDGSNL